MVSFCFGFFVSVREKNDPLFRIKRFMGTQKGISRPKKRRKAGAPVPVCHNRNGGKKAASS